MLNLFQFLACRRATDFGSAKSVVLSLALALLLAVAPARGASITDGPPPDYGLTWKTIGAAGNRGTLPSEAPLLPSSIPSVGSVGYEFRLTQTEITRNQWLEFVRAYMPYYPGSHSLPSPEFVGTGFISLINGYASPNRPVTMSWEYAARYCNWLHNGQAANREAFEQGVYDTTTFTRNPDGSYNHYLAHAPDAKYWIPSLDEWIKGAYYDPNKFGDGQEGYWRYPGKSDVPIIGGPPSAGGQTNAAPFSLGSPLNAGSYPDVQSPWGLLDNSGGVQEWLGSPDTLDPYGIHIPAVKGSSVILYDEDFDRISSVSGRAPIRASNSLAR